MLKLSGSPEGEINDSSRHILSNSAIIDVPHIIQSHRHSRGQLLFAAIGKMKATVNGKCWCLSPGNAIWIPSGAIHDIYAGEAIEYRSVYIDPVAAQSIALSSGVVGIRPLIRELVNESISFGNGYSLNSPEARLNDILLEQLKMMANEACPVMLPANPKLSKLCEMILGDPSDKISLQEWGKQCGASERNLARLFKKQTGISFTQWRHRVQVSHAIERIKAGDSVTTVSTNLGYNSSSAFTNMFKRISGFPPRKYMNKNI